LVLYKNQIPKPKTACTTTSPHHNTTSPPPQVATANHSTQCCTNAAPRTLAGHDRVGSPLDCDRLPKRLLAVGENHANKTYIELL
jgi:hypothetical protein